jgi:large subunit ribosomal protein L22
MAEVKAQLNGLRIAPRKVRAVARLVKGKDVVNAAGQLEFYMRRSAPALLKLLNSAVANAENTYHMVKENLYVKDFIVNEGVKLRRFKPKGFGRVSPLQKKTSLIQLVLAERVAGMKRQVEKAAKAHDHEHVHEHAEEKTKDKKPELKTELGKKSGSGGFAKRIFRRKQV